VAAGVRAGCPGRCPGWRLVSSPEAAGVRCGVHCADAPGRSVSAGSARGVRLAMRPDAERVASALAARRAAVPRPARPHCSAAPSGRVSGLGPWCPPHAGRVSIVVSALARCDRRRPRCRRTLDGWTVRPSGPFVHRRQGPVCGRPSLDEWRTVSPPPGAFGRPAPVRLGSLVPHPNLRGTRLMNELGPNAYGEVCDPGRVADCHLVLPLPAGVGSGLVGRQP
jgi:hypothetical protein